MTNSKVPDIGPTKSASPDHKKWLEGISSPLKPNFKVKDQEVDKRGNLSYYSGQPQYEEDSPTISEIKKKEYCITQIYKTGEKVAGIWNEKGRKPVGYNVYISGIFRIFLPYLTAGSKKEGEMNFELPKMSWEREIESILMDYLNHMIENWERLLELNPNLKAGRFFSNPRREEALGYLRGYQSVREFLKREVGMRTTIKAPDFTAGSKKGNHAK
jgi:hypothetical protein